MEDQMQSYNERGVSVISAEGGEEENGVCTWGNLKQITVNTMMGTNHGL